MAIDDGGRAIRVKANRLVRALTPTPTTDSIATPTANPPQPTYSATAPADEPNIMSTEPSENAPNNHLGHPSSSIPPRKTLPPRPNRGINRWRQTEPQSGNIYEIENIVDYKVTQKSTRLYLTLWKGYAPAEDT